jgi:hypothetical protein
MKPTEPGHYPCDYGFGPEIVKIKKINESFVICFIGSSEWIYLNYFCKRNTVKFGPRIPGWTPEEQERQAILEKIARALPWYAKDKSGRERVFRNDPEMHDKEFKGWLSDGSEVEIGRTNPPDDWKSTKRRIDR